MSNSPDKPKKYEETLMDALFYDEYDLDVNRAGQLTPRQMHRLDAARKKAISQWIMPTSIVAFFTAVCLGGLVRSVEQALFALTIGGVLAASFYRSAGVSSQRLAADMRDPQISIVEGRVELLVNGVQNNVNFLMRVGDIRFSLKRDGFFAFKNGDPYRIYYTARSKQILAAEWLRDTDENLILDSEEDAEISPEDAELLFAGEKPKHHAD